nr:type II CRISPR RNA-guided endonuclease Cas9 [Corynebacterium lactis]
MELRYVVGIDVGLFSVGFSAIEVDEVGMPIRLLNSMSLIHDSGLDPNNQKEAKTRKAVSGVARRTRRLYATRKKRLAALDSFLTKYNYPLVNLEKEADKIAWSARSTLATEKVETPEEMRKLLSIAIRHIARHRGWRNPYIPAERLCTQRQPSDKFKILERKAHEAAKKSIPSDPTLAQLVDALPNGATQLRGKNGFLSEALNQQDFANEILKIASMQELDPQFVHELLLKVFYAKSPKGLAEKFVGKDELDPSQPRAWRATIAFNEYRIISLLANVRIADPGSPTSAQRRLTVQERQKVFNLLNSWTKKNSPTWTDIAELLGIDRGALKGTASANDDGERMSAVPPINQTHQIMWNCQVKPLREFWRKGSAAMRSALISELSNVEAPEEESPEAISAASVIRALPPEEMEKLETIRLPHGRAAYSVKTLERIAGHILNNEADLHEARQAIFGVDNHWKPAAAPIAEPTGNPAVDRTLSAINRWLLLAEKRWGVPFSINIETARDGFKSASVARVIERGNNKRATRNLETRQEIAEKLGVEGRVRSSDMLRYQAIQRQNGQCAYCGTTITFKSAEMDHVVPRAGAGSTNRRNNLLAACHKCNLSKGKLPFAVWAASEKSGPNVSLQGAIDRVNQWPTDSGLTTREMKDFQQSVIKNLKRTSGDDKIDARSIESVAWMAIELRHRMIGHFEKQGKLTPKVRVFSGAVTASARKAAGIEKQITMLGGGHGKNRLDRRHHALDAAVIALMTYTTAQTLLERESLRRAENTVQKPDADFGTWKEYRGRNQQNKYLFEQWNNRMRAAVPMLQEALDQNRIAVTQNLRLRLGNGQAHEAGIGKLVSAQVGDALPVDLIDRAASPALWCALTRLPDFDWKDGLPADSTRNIIVNGTHFGPNDRIEFFGVKAGAIAVRGGFAELGASFHHARLYRVPVGKRHAYCMMRVYTVDLVRHQHEDLFTVELLPQSISVRQCEAKLRKALREGTAEYITWFVVGDELHFDASKVATGQAETFLQEFGDIRSWTVKGFYSDSKLRLKPTVLSAEGITDDVDGDSIKIIDSPGWRPSINKVFGLGHVTIVRRDAHGRPRLSTRSNLPVSVQIDS